MNDQHILLELRSKIGKMFGSAQILIWDDVWHKDRTFLCETNLDVYYFLKKKQEETISTYCFNRDIQEQFENALWIIDTDDMSNPFERVKEIRKINKNNLILFMPNKNSHFDQLENVLMDCGYRKHPAYYNFVEYDCPDDVRIALYQKIADSVLELFPREVLKEERNLHTDMSRESGIRSAGHIIRYHIAFPFINKGDTVLDCACGLGYGSKMLGSCSPSQRVIGIDISQIAINYANTLYRDGKCEFRLGDAQNLEGIEDDSVDFITSFETLEHIPYPEKFLSEAFRVLKPYGKILVSVPYRWVDETGNDPSPYHLHAYDFEKLLKQIRVCFRAERAWSLSMSGYWENGRVINTPPHLYEVAMDNEMPVDTECILLLASKYPTSKKMESSNWNFTTVISAITALFKRY